MNRIIGIIMLGFIGLTQAIGLGIAWLIGLIYLLIQEIVGSKRFRVKFNKLNNIFVSEFKDILKAYKNVFEGL